MMQKDGLDRPAGIGRRTVFGLAAAAAALPLLPVPNAAAQAVPAPGLGGATATQGAGFYRFRIGSFTATVISDGAVQMPPYPIFGINAEKAVFDQALTARFLPTDRATIHLNILVIDTGKNLVMIDGGTGGLFGPTAGRLPAFLANAGIDPARIDTIVISHAHPDHIGGLATKDGTLVFPNAHYAVNEKEYAFWLSPPAGADATFVTVAQTALKAIRERTRFFATESEIVPGVTAIPAPGHTPGHAVVMIHDGTSGMLHLVDAVHHFVTALGHPDWQVQFDVDRPQAVETRKRLLDGAATDRLLVATYHFPFPGIGHIGRRDGAYEWVPEVWQWE